MIFAITRIRCLNDVEDGAPGDEMHETGRGRA